MRKMQHALVNQGRLSRNLLVNRELTPRANPSNLPGKHCVQHATVQFQCARQSLGRENGIDLKPFIGTQRVGSPPRKGWPAIRK